MPPAKGKIASLEEYRAKRDFTRTGEPRGEVKPKPGPKGSADRLFYAIQKHRARRTHFDLRLELDGVLKSWAVTKGPSLDPAEKRLAVRTEDHPLEYGSFEGKIPEGEYGAGAVMLWDRGTWTPKGDPQEGLEKGQLKFTLKGERLKGGFALVRLAPRGKERRENWLLIKERDDKADRSADPVREWTKSITTGRTFDEIAAGEDIWTSREVSPHVSAEGPQAPSKRTVLPMPKFRAPQLAMLASKPPSGPGWLHEIKFDGYRIIAAVAGGKCKLYTRTGLDWTKRFRGLDQAIAQVPARSALIDGEVTVVDENGRTDFGRLQNALKSGEDPLHYYAFDLLEIDGEDIAHLPLIERKARLSELLREAPEAILYSDHIAGDGEKVLAESCRMGLEGIVSKRADQPYVSRRTDSWLKTKCTGRDEFVIGGWQPSTKDRPFSSLLLGEYDGTELRYRGRVGTGFDAEGLRDLSQKLRGLARNTSPFADVPAAVARKAKWAEPRLVAQIAYSERTRDGYLRQPRFLGLREDKPARAVTVPKAEKSEAGPCAQPPARQRPRPKLTHPDKILFAGAGISKAELAEYWRKIAYLALPHIRGRPLSLVRCPEGSGRGCFFQRHHTRGMPKAIEPAPIPEKNGKIEQFLKIEDSAGLEAAAQIGAIELHVWGACVAAIETPDRLVFDLDPDPGIPFAQVKQAAEDFRTLLDAAELTSFALLTGGKGIHVIAPLAPVLDWDALKNFAKGVATRLAADDPARFTAVMSKSRRQGKIYIDYLRNDRGSSAIAPYSPRARETASVATPVAWTELSRVERADSYSITTLPRRIASLRGRDPWEGYFDLKQRISQAALRMFSLAHT